jgi:hypothetical protein
MEGDDFLPKKADRLFQKMIVTDIQEHLLLEFGQIS